MLFLFLPKGGVGSTSALKLAILVVLYKGQTQWMDKGTDHSDPEVDPMP